MRVGPAGTRARTRARACAGRARPLPAQPRRTRAAAPALPRAAALAYGMVWKALFAGFLATLMTAAVVGAMPVSIFR